VQSTYDNANITAPEHPKYSSIPISNFIIARRFCKARYIWYRNSHGLSTVWLYTTTAYTALAWRRAVGLIKTVQDRWIVSIDHQQNVI